MSQNFDQIDIRILESLQRDATLSMDALADHVHLSRNACWRRMKRLEEDGVIKKRVVLLDPSHLECGLQVVVMIKAGAHDAAWLERFSATIRKFPEIVGAYRMTGELDYMLRVRVADVARYDVFYKQLISQVPLLDISASFVMEDIKDTTAIPLPVQGRAL